MRVVIDLTPTVQRHAGVGRYAGELACALLAADSDVEVTPFYTDRLGRKPAPPLDALPASALRWSNKPWRLSAFLSACGRVPMDSLVGQGDIFHATDHVLPHLARARSVFTLHDLSFITRPETHLGSNRWFLRLAVPMFLRRSNAVICVSEHTRADAIRHYRLDESKIHVIPEGVNSRFQPMEDPSVRLAVRAKYGLPEEFILFVGTIEPRKNLVALLGAYRELRAEGRPEKLVVVGRKGWLHGPTFSRLRELGLEGEVLFLGYVADDDLPAIYSAASVFVFPSLYEGFGLPPLEAMACGTPVVCSNASSLPEVCGDAAILVPPTDVLAMTAALRRVLDDPELRLQLRSRGLRQAARFSWEEVAARTISVYREVIGESRAVSTRLWPR